jgi:hypothetical protein
MDVEAVLGILALVAAVFSTLWGTGGWGALRRRSIQQELDLAKDLPDSETKVALTEYIEEEIDLYLYQLTTQPPPNRAPAYGALAVGVGVVFGLAIAFPDADILVIYLVEGGFIVLFFCAYGWILRSRLIERRRRRHGDLLALARSARQISPAEASDSGSDPSAPPRTE